MTKKPRRLCHLSQLLAFCPADSSSSCRLRHKARPHASAAVAHKGHGFVCVPFPRVVEENMALARGSPSFRAGIVHEIGGIFRPPGSRPPDTRDVATAEERWDSRTGGPPHTSQKPGAATETASRWRNGKVSGTEVTARKAGGLHVLIESLPVGIEIGRVGDW